MDRAQGLSRRAERGSHHVGQRHQARNMAAAQSRRGRLPISRRGEFDIPSEACPAHTHSPEIESEVGTAARVLNTPRLQQNTIPLGLLTPRTDEGQIHDVDDSDEHDDENEDDDNDNDHNIMPSNYSGPHPTNFNNDIAIIPSHHPQRIWTHHATPIIDLRAVQRSQMLSQFLHSQFPSAQAKAALTSRRSYLAALPEIDTSNAPLLRAAIDTLCFAHIGAQTHDRRLLRESQQSYGRVLALLRRDIGRVGTSSSSSSHNTVTSNPRALITSIMLLCLYDDALPNPDQTPNNWAAHYWGCQQILTAYGPSILNLADPFTRLLYWNLRMPLLFLGIARRQAVVFGRAEWIAHADANSESRGVLRDFYRPAMLIPGLLERVDDLVASPSPSALFDLLTSFDTTRAALQKWYTSLPASTTKPIKIPTSSATPFDITIEEHLFMSASTLFPHVLDFPSSGLIQSHTLLHMTLLILDTALLRLTHFLPPSTLTSHLPTLSPTHLLPSASLSAASLLQSIYHYSHPSPSDPPSLPIADFCRFLIDLALGFYADAAMHRELGYAQALRVATGLRIERIEREAQKTTLCRLRDISPGCVRATRWRSRGGVEDW